MKVWELIEMLEATDPDFDVVMETSAEGGGHYEITNIDEEIENGVTWAVLTDFPVDPS